LSILQLDANLKDDGVAAIKRQVTLWNVWEMGRFINLGVREMRAQPKAEFAPFAHQGGWTKGIDLTGGNMPNTGERREIIGRVNAKEAEMVQQSKKLVAKTKQGSASTDAKNTARSSGTRRKRSPTN
jgi:hypothetical protein